MIMKKLPNQKLALSLFFLACLIGPLFPVKQVVAQTKMVASTTDEQPFEIKVNINEAAVEELVRQLKGIGTKRAQAIINYRNTHGPFTNIDQLIKVPGISAAMVAANKVRLII